MGAAMRTLESLAQTWLEEAETLERYRDERGAELCRLHARELQEAMRNGLDEVYTLSKAAELSGYSEDHLRHLVADGTIPNAGRKGAPRIRRADLPVKPGQTRPEAPGGTEEDVESILASLETR